MYNAKTESTIKNIKANLLNAEIAINQKSLLVDKETADILNNYKDHLKNAVAELIKKVINVSEKCDDEFKQDLKLDQVLEASLKLTDAVIEEVNNFKIKTDDELEIENIKESVRNMFEDDNKDYDYIMDCVREVGESLVSTIESQIADKSNDVDTRDLVYDIAEKSLSTLREKLDNQKNKEATLKY